MYGEMPTIKIGKYTIAMMTDKENETRIWVQEFDNKGDEKEAGEFPSVLLEPYIKEFFNKHI